MKDLKERSINVKGRTRITLFDKNGNFKTQREVENLITDDGFDYMCSQVGHSVQASMHYCAIGTGDTGADVTDTTLESESARVSGVYDHTEDTKIYENEATFGAGVGAGAIVEAGMLNASENGTLFNRQTFGVITKGAGDILKVEWTITLS